MNEFITIILTLVILAGVLGIVYVMLYNNLQAHKIKINEAESVIDELLRSKYDIFIKIKKIILDNTDVNKKVFKDLDTIKDKNFSSFDFERNLTNINTLIDQIKLDYTKLKDNEDFSETYEEIYKLNEKLEAAKSFYNKYTSLLNKAIKKFPSNLLARLHNIEVQTYFDGKDLFDDNIEDFKL